MTVKKTWKTGLNNSGVFIQDLEKSNHKFDNHFRCKICNYSNFRLHDEGMVVHTGPLSGRQMFIEKGTSDVFCHDCIKYAEAVNESNFEDFEYKNKTYKPLKRPDPTIRETKEEKAVFDQTTFGKEDSLERVANYSSEDDHDDDPWEKIYQETITSDYDPWLVALNSGLAGTSNEYSDEEWDELEKFNKDNSSWENILNNKEKNNNGKEEQIHIPLLQGHSEVDEFQVS